MSRTPILGLDESQRAFILHFSNHLCNLLFSSGAPILLMNRHKIRTFFRIWKRRNVCAPARICAFTHMYKACACSLNDACKNQQMTQEVGENDHSPMHMSLPALANAGVCRALMHDSARNSYSSFQTSIPSKDLLGRNHVWSCRTLCLADCTTSFAVFRSALLAR